MTANSSNVKHIETNFPNVILPYGSESARIVDVIIGYLSAGAAIYMLFTVFTNAYDSEHNKVLTYSEKLKELAYKFTPPFLLL